MKHRLLRREIMMWLWPTSSNQSLRLQVILTALIWMQHLKHVFVWSSVGAWHPKKQLETKRRSLQNLIAVCRCLWTGLAFEWGLLLNRACFWTLLFDFDDPFRHCGVTRGSRACGGRCEGFRTWILNIKTFHLRFGVFSSVQSLKFPKAQIPSNTWFCSFCPSILVTLPSDMFEIIFQDPVIPGRATTWNTPRRLR